MPPSFLCTFAGMRLAKPNLTFSWFTKSKTPVFVDWSSQMLRKSSHPSTAEKGWYLRDFCAPSFPLFFYKNSPFQHIYICDGFLTHYLKPCNLSPYKGASFWAPSHLIPLVASLLEAFSWPFTLLSDWLCIHHRFLPNCLSQHELLCYSASFCSPSFSTIKEHATVSTTG